MTTRSGKRKKGPVPNHDRGYKRLFSHPETVQELLLGFVEEGWVRDLDFSSLENIDHGFVGDDLEGRSSDVIWKIRWEDGQGDLYLLLELQSTSYHFMAARLQTYMGLLQEQVIRTKRLRPRDHLPVVLPLSQATGAGASPKLQRLVPVSCAEGVQRDYNS